MSADLSDLQMLMHQLGPATPGIEAIIEDDIESWEVQLDDGATLCIAFQCEPAEAVFSCLLGPTPVHRQTEIYAAMLCANLLYQGVAPIKFALNHPAGELMLIAAYPLLGMSLDSLQKNLSSFHAYARHFAEQVVVEESNTDAKPLALPDDSSLSGYLTAHLQA